MWRSLSWLQIILTIILQEDLSLEGVASQAGFSKYHFSRLFKQYTDSTFYKYLNQKRIEFAKTLLQDPGSECDGGGI